MPCSDVTETILIILDPEDQLEHYVLRKKSCERLVGAEAMLTAQLFGWSVDRILSIDAESFLSTQSCEDEMEAFLIAKHLYALQAALNAYVGSEPAGKKAICAVAEIATDAEGTTIEARIAIDLLTEKIRACHDVEK